MKLYGFPQTRSIRVLWTLRELDVEFEFINVDPTKVEHRRPEFLAVNPAGELPVLVDGDFIPACFCTAPAAAYEAAYAVKRRASPHGGENLGSGKDVFRGA